MCQLPQGIVPGVGVGVDPEIIHTPICSEVVHEIPSHPSCYEALSTAQLLLPCSILHHSLRVYLYALKIWDAGEPREPPPFTPAPPPTAVSAAAPQVTREVLFISCLLHDLGASNALASQPLRFETAGADAVADLLARHDTDPAVVREAWLAVALHSSPHVAEGAGGLVRALRIAVLVDFKALGDGVVPAGFVEEVEVMLPRMDVERDLGDAVVRQARALRSKAPGGSWPGDLLRAADAEPGWDGVNKAF